MQFLSLFLDITKMAYFWWKMLMSVELKGCLTWFIYNSLYFGSSVVKGVSPLSVSSYEKAHPE